MNEQQNDFENADGGVAVADFQANDQNDSPLDITCGSSDNHEKLGKHAAICKVISEIDGLKAPAAEIVGHVKARYGIEVSSGYVRLVQKALQSGAPASIGGGRKRGRKPGQKTAAARQQQPKEVKSTAGESTQSTNVSSAPAKLDIFDPNLTAKLDISILAAVIARRGTSVVRRFCDTVDQFGR